jgi:hypothetical protein
MQSTLAGLAFLVFIASGFAALVGGAGQPGGRWLVNVFVAWTVAVGLGAGVIQRDFWPFTTWPLVAAIHPPIAEHARMVVVDRAGHEHDVDHRAVEPFPFNELLAWLNGRFLAMPADRQHAAAEYLVAIVERAAARARRGEPVSTRRRWGPLTAPYFILHPDRWDDPAVAPAGRLDGLRFYRESWNVEARAIDPGAVDRRLMYEYRRR